MVRERTNVQRRKGDDIFNTLITKFIYYMLIIQILITTMNISNVDNQESVDNQYKYTEYISIFYNHLPKNCSLSQELIQKLLHIKNPNINLQLLTAELMLYLELEFPRLENENAYVSVYCLFVYLSWF